MLKGRCETQKINWCAIYYIHVNNQDYCDFTIGRWGECKGNGGHEKALANKIAISELKKRKKAGDTLNKKEKKQMNFENKNNTSPLTDFSQRKVVTVEVVPRHPLWMESPMVQTQKQLR